MFDFLIFPRKKKEVKDIPVVDEDVSRAAVGVLVPRHASDHRHVFAELSLAPISLTPKVFGERGHSGFEEDTSVQTVVLHDFCLGCTGSIWCECRRLSG